MRLMYIMKHMRMWNFTRNRYHGGGRCRSIINQDLLRGSLSAIDYLPGESLGVSKGNYSPIVFSSVVIIIA